jgi:hypothetical protein
MLTALLATVLVFVAVGLLLYLVTLLYYGIRAATGGRRSGSAARRGGTGGLRMVRSASGTAASGTWTVGIERWRINRCITHGRRGDALREQGNLDAALREYQAAFFLHPVRDRQLATIVANHHTGLLSRLIAITEDVQGGTVRLFSLAKVDRLLNERSDLQRRHLTNRQSSDRQRGGGVHQQLVQNRRDLQAALRQLIVEIQASRPAQQLH